MQELNFTPDDILLDEYGLALDYVRGRCVKLFIERGEANDCWKINDIADPEYQTWIHRYGSNETLVNSVLNDGKTYTLCEEVEPKTPTARQLEEFPPERFIDYGYILWL